MGTLHLLSFLITLPAILYSDHFGVQYLLGKTETVDIKLAQKLHIIVFLGLGLIIASGLYLTLPAWDFYLSDNLFRVKILFVLALILNGLFIGKLLKVASNKPYRYLTNMQKVTLLISGGISGASWFMSFVIGFFYL